MDEKQKLVFPLCQIRGKRERIVDLVMLKVTVLVRGNVSAVDKQGVIPIAGKADGDLPAAMQLCNGK